MKYLDGQQIESVRTLKTWYDGDSIEVSTGKKTYRMPVETINAMTCDFKFEVIKKKKYEYLVNPKSFYPDL